MASSYWSLLIGALLLAGCGSDRQRAGQSSDTTAMGHMDSGGMQMMPAMKAHVDSMTRMSPDKVQAMMSRHEAMMSQMMDRMGADMRQMNMSGTSDWTALTDSVKQDLAELPSLKGERLPLRMRAHANRVKRLIAMHQAMMK